MHFLHEDRCTIFLGNATINKYILYLHLKPLWDNKVATLKNVLFICSVNKLRSPTAEQVFADWPSVEVDSAGLSPSATVELSTEQIAWADIIFVMEKAHRNKLSKKFKKHLNGKRVICLDIPDDYDFMDEVLIRILKTKVSPYLR